MGLASALTTALTGLTAAEATIDVAGNNLANAQTVGFKASEAVFATQFLQTQTLGSSPTNSDGGTNPRQIGLGTRVAEITPDFSQGTIEVSSNPSDLAIQGEGFFIAQGAGGEQLYTRNGIFKTNSQNELVTIAGNRLLGYGIDDSYTVQTTQLVPIQIPLGAAAVAQATANVFLEGTLSPSGDVADTAEVIESAIMGDGSIQRPDSTAIGITGVSKPVSTGVDFTVGTTPVDTAGFARAQQEGVGGNIVDGATLEYRVTFSDAARSNESFASALLATPITVNDLGDTIADNNSADLTNLPTSTDPAFTQTNVYRSRDGGTSYQLVGTVASGVTSYSDVTDGDLGVTLPAGLMDITDPAYGGNFDAGDAPQYRFTYGDATGTETLAADARTITLSGTTGNGKAVTVTDIPTNANYAQLNVYRSDDSGSTFNKINTMAMPSAATTTYVDDGTAAPTDPLETQTTISGNYTYRVTFYSTLSGDAMDSRPSLDVGPVNVTDGRIQLSNLPTPTTGGAVPYDKVRIYRNLASDSSSFYLVATVDPGTTYTDGKTDAQISDLTIAGNKAIDPDGPKIASQTLLTNVVRRDGNDFNSVFDLGTLTFSAKKGGRSMEEKTFTVAATSTMQDLVSFMVDSMGIRVATDDPQNPIPGSVNNIPNETGTLATGATIQSGKVRVVSNNGVDNALSVGLASFQLAKGDGTIENPSLAFASVQGAVGESAVTDFIAYDSLGIPVRVRLTAALESRSGTTTTYRWYADSPDNDPLTGTEVGVGTGLVSFDGEGNLIGTSNSIVSIDRRNVPSASPLEFSLDFSQMSGLETDTSYVSASRQDGFGTGKLTSFIIGEDGRIRGVFTNGATRDLGQIRLVRFANTSGLEQRGQNMYSAGVNSGLPVQGNPGDEGIGQVIAGAVELSNTDIGSNLIDLILAQTQYRGNTRVITTAQQLLDELLNLRR